MTRTLTHMTPICGYQIVTRPQAMMSSFFFFYDMMSSLSIQRILVFAVFARGLDHRGPRL